MTFYARAVCDGCATATVDIQLPEAKAPLRLIEALHAAHWATPLTGVWLCPTCAAITEINPVPAVVTEAMF